MQWIDPVLPAGAGTKRSASDLESVPDGQQAPRPGMPVIYTDENFLVVHKPYDVRMDGEHNITVESLALEWLASMGTHAASCHVPGWKKGAVASAAAAAPAMNGDGDTSGGKDGVQAAEDKSEKTAYVHNSGMRGVASAPAAPLLRFAHRLDYATSGVLFMALNRKVRMCIYKCTYVQGALHI